LRSASRRSGRTSVEVTDLGLMAAVYHYAEE
jgi:hypothetical protein